RSMPEPSGRRMSVRHRSYWLRDRWLRASARLDAVSHLKPIRPNVMTSNSRMSRSSSTTSALRVSAIRPSNIPPILKLFGIAAASLEGRARKSDTETAAASRQRNVVKRGLVGAAELAGDVQAQAGAVAGGGEERPEQLLGDPLGHAGAAVDHVHHRLAVVVDMDVDADP